MKTRIIECVPNFSEGRDKNVIKSITDAIKSVKGINLLDVDPGEVSNARQNLSTCAAITALIPAWVRPTCALSSQSQV